MEKQLEQLTGYARNQTNDVKKRAEETRTITFIASTRAPDRHGSVLDQAEWSLENFRKNPIIGYQHNLYGDSMCNAPDPDDVIGRGVNVKVEGGILILDIVFDRNKEKAEKIFRKVQDGFLNAVSVGFIPILNEYGEESRKGDLERGENPDLDYMFGQELLEVSVVNIPSNPEAVKRSFRNQTATALKGIQRMLNVGFDEIRGMKVADVLNALEDSKGLPRSVNATETPEFEEVTTTEEIEPKAETPKVEEAEVKANEVSEDASLSVEEARTQLNKRKLNFKLNG